MSNNTQQQPQQQHGTALSGARGNGISKVMESVIITSRWLLDLIYVGLVLVLVMCVAKFFQGMWALAFEALPDNVEQFVASGLALIDLGMFANLVIMIVQGGHQIFIRRLAMDPSVRPQWLDHIDTGTLKVKVGWTVATMVLIKLVGDLVAHTPLATIYEDVLVLGMALASATVFALVYWLMHPNAVVNNPCAPAVNHAYVGPQPTLASCHPGHTGLTGHAYTEPEQGAPPKLAAEH